MLDDLCGKVSHKSQLCGQLAGVAEPLEERLAVAVALCPSRDTAGMDPLWPGPIELVQFCCTSSPRGEHKLHQHTCSCLRVPEIANSKQNLETPCSL